MTGLTSIQRLFAIAIAGAAITACGFGDDRNHPIGDDVGAVCGDGAMNFDGGSSVCSAAHR